VNGYRLTVEADTTTIETLRQNATQLGVDAELITVEPLPDPEPDWQPGDIVDIARPAAVKRYVILAGGKAVELDGLQRVLDREDMGWSRLWRHGLITVVSRAVP
jgi:hypothetical protein